MSLSSNLFSLNQQMQFSRNYDSGGEVDDADFSRTSYYFLMPVGGGDFNADQESFFRHDSTPFISADAVTISPCKYARRDLNSMNVHGRRDRVVSNWLV